MKNVELSPPAGHTPIYGRFDISENGTVAHFEFSPWNFTEGELRVRISAFDALPGQPARELIAMSERRWKIVHRNCKFTTNEELERELSVPLPPSMPIQN